MSDFPEPKYKHQKIHPHLIGGVSVWRIVLRDEDGDLYTRWVSATTAKSASDFAHDEFLSGVVVSVTEVGPLDITSEILSAVVRVYEERKAGR